MLRTLIVAASASLAAAGAHADCELLSASDAELVLGLGITDLTGDDAEFQCMFLGGSPQGTLIVQFADAGYYDQASILPPHTPQDVGDRGRSNIDTNGITALQFVKGNKTVTMSARSSSASDRDYLDAMVEIGNRIAERLE